MTDSIFYCFGVPVAVQRSDGIVRRVELTSEDRAFIEERLEIPHGPIVFDAAPTLSIDDLLRKTPLPYIRTPPTPGIVAVDVA